MQVPLYRISCEPGDVAAVAKAMEEKMFWSIGPEVEAFEKKLADFVGAKHCVVVNSGTSALHAALLALGVGRGDEVLVPSFTFVATANAPWFVGAAPTFVDIEPEFLSLDPATIPHASRRSAKAMIPIHYGGIPGAVDAWEAFAQESGVPIIEDAAEAMGATFNGRRIGTIGRVGILSFCANKIITTGEGGAIVTEDDEIAERCRLLRSHGRQDSGNYFDPTTRSQYLAVGYNWRLSNIAAALGLAQIHRAADLIRQRRKAVKAYSDLLASAPSNVRARVSFVLESGPRTSVYQMFSARIKGEGRRDRVQQALTQAGIGCRLYFSPAHTFQSLSVQGKDPTDRLPVTMAASRECLSLPMFPDISDAEIHYVVENLVRAVRD